MRGSDVPAADAIATINRFGTALVSSTNAAEIFQLAGEAAHALAPDAMLFVSRLAADGVLMQGAWQHGLDGFIDPLKKSLGIDLMARTFSLARATPEECSRYLNSTLFHYKDGLYNLAVRTIPRQTCRAMEGILHLGSVYAIGFAWNKKHYGTLVLLFPEGKCLENAAAIETIVHLGSVGLQRVIAEDAMRQLQENRGRMLKLDALGMLAGGIAHEFNNLFAGLFGYIECARAKNPSPATDPLTDALACMDRATLMTSKLLTFSPGGAPVLQKAPLFPFAEEAVTSAIYGAGVSCTVMKTPELVECLYDREQLGPVLAEMGRNAVEAMPRGGELTLSAAMVTLPKDNPSALHEGTYIRLSLTDRGIGIPAGAMTHIFNPFFTTKPAHGGLNLAIAWSVLRRHGGGIEVESADGVGTTFHLFLQAGSA
jgi:signal transduction histidine kinase